MNCTLPMSKYTWVHLYIHGKPEVVLEMAEPISIAYMWIGHTLLLPSLIGILTHKTNFS